MRAMTLTALMMASLTAACTTTPASSPALCAGTEAAARELASALLVDGGPQSKRAGLALLDKRAAGCG